MQLVFVISLKTTGPILTNFPVYHVYEKKVTCDTICNFCDRNHGNMFVRLQELLDVRRWENLVQQFRHENFKLYQLNNHSMFTVALQAGLSALKTPYPYSDVIPCGLLILSLFVTLKVLRFNLGKIKPMKVLDFLPQSFELRKYLKLIWQHRYQMQNVTSRHPLLSFQNRSLKYTIYDQLSH